MHVRSGDAESIAVPAQEGILLRSLAGLTAAAECSTGINQLPAAPPVRGVFVDMSFRLQILAATAALALLVPGAAMAADNEFAAQLTDLAKSQLRQIAENPVLIDAIRAQNAASSG